MISPKKTLLVTLSLALVVSCSKPTDQDVRQFVYAAQEGQLSKVQSMLEENSALLDGMTQGGNSTALWIAALKGHVDIVHYLVEKGADVDLHDPGSTNPLQAAALSGTPELVTYLLEQGANANGDYDEPFSAAMKREIERDGGARKADYDKVYELMQAAGMK